MLEKPRGKLLSICTEHHLALVYLFGSQAGEGLALLEGRTFRTGDALADLDVGVVTKIPLPEAVARTKYYASLYDEFTDLFAPFTLDLCLLEENHSVFQMEAMNGICIYYCDERTREDYEMRILRRAADFRPFLARYLREVLEEV
ncbi:MAG: nucleotidyltransferase domain-containing protein [Patescibacteria group bacterium]